MVYSIVVIENSVAQLRVIKYLQILRYYAFSDSLIDGVLIDNEVTMMILSILTIYLILIQPGWLERSSP